MTRLGRYLARVLLYNVACLRSKSRYLRLVGAKVGQDCQLIAPIANFGTEPYLVRIGNRVTVTDGVRFITHDASTRLFRDQVPGMNRFGNMFGPVEIGDNCFIGVDAILLPGTSIGDDSIVGAGAVVKGAFPKGSVIAGVPARRIGSFQDYVTRVRQRMVPLTAKNRRELRAQLLNFFFSSERHRTEVNE